MAITWPLAVTAFMDLLQVQSVTPRLMWQQELSHQASGGVIAKDLGPALWVADINTVLLSADDAADIECMIESLTGSIGTFYCYNTFRRYPKMDPTGSIVGANAVKIKAVTANTAVSLKTLPAAYTITRGDFIQVLSGTVVGYYRALETVTSDGAGDTAAFAVAPYLKGGIAVDDAVTIKKASFLARILPGSYSVESDVMFSKIGFKAIQVAI